jgi:UDP-glucose 4-epimerase
MNKVVVSGASGTIGIAFVKKLLLEDYEVLVLLNKNSKRNWFFEQTKGVKIKYISINSYSKYIPREIYDVFFHLAWEGGGDRFNVTKNNNSALTSGDAVNLARRFGCKKFVGAGSQSECGFQEEFISSLSVCMPNNPFGISKLNAFHLTKYLCNLNNIDFVWLRILSVYGPFDRSNSLITSTIKNCINNKETQFTSGEQYWEYIFSKDVADLLFLVCNKKLNNQILVVSSGSKRKLKFFIEQIAVLFDKDLSAGLGKNSETKTYNLISDISETKRKLKWEPKTNFIKGIKETSNHLKLFEAVLKKNHIIFDFDGTIIDSKNSILNCLKISLEKNNINIDELILDSLISKPLNEILDNFVKNDKNLKEKIINDFKLIYDKEECLNVKLVENTVDLLKYLKSTQTNIYLATNKRFFPTMKILNFFELKSFFKSIYCVDSNDLSFISKSQMVKHLTKENQIKKKECLLIGDSEIDFISAKNNGIDFHLVDLIN